MSAKPEDLAGLIAAINPQGATLLTGVVTAWDSTDGHTVMAGGAVFTPTAVLSALTTPQAGDKVALIIYRNTVLLLGAVISPAFASGDGQG